MPPGNKGLQGDLNVKNGYLPPAAYAHLTDRGDPDGVKDGDYWSEELTQYAAEVPPIGCNDQYLDKVEVGQDEVYFPTEALAEVML